MKKTVLLAALSIFLIAGCKGGGGGSSGFSGKVEGFSFGMSVSDAKGILKSMGFDKIRVKERKSKKMGFTLFRLRAKKKDVKKGLRRVKAFFPKGKLLRFRLYYEDKDPMRYMGWVKKFGKPTKVKGLNAAWLLKGDVFIDARTNGSKVTLADFGQALNMKVIPPERVEKIKARLLKK